MLGMLTFSAPWHNGSSKMFKLGSVICFTDAAGQKNVASQQLDKIWDSHLNWFVASSVFICQKGDFPGVRLRHGD